MDKRVFVVVLLVTLLNPWIWKIIPENFFLALLLVILSVSLFAVSCLKKYKTLIVTLTLVLTVLISSIVFSAAFDRELFIASNQEQLRQDSKHLYFSHDLGTLYLNKVGLYFYHNLDLPLYKLQGNLFSNLDLNLYFFASHPRERAGVGEFEKYHLIALPFFIAGIIISLQKKPWLLSFYLGAITIAGAFIRPDYVFGSVLSFPLINVIISLGLIYFLNVLNVRKKGLGILK